MRSAIILGAGKGTRMKSDTPKILHTIIDRPMARYIVDALKKAGVTRIVMVAGWKADMVKEAFPDLEIAIQEPQLGSGHAVMRASMLEGEEGDTLVINGDGPCIQPETLEKLFEANKDASMTLLTSILEDGAHYGRVIRNSDGSVAEIVEAKDCNESQRAVKEINAGMYCFKTKDLFDGLKHLTTNNAQHEYYITDLAKIFNAQGKRVNALPAQDRDETMGINDKKELAIASRWLRNKINERLLEDGVQITDPARTTIGPDVIIGRDVIIDPDTEILGHSELEDGVIVRSGSRIVNGIIKKGTVIDASRVYNGMVPAGSHIGPFAAEGKEKQQEIEKES